MVEYRTCETATEAMNGVVQGADGGDTVPHPHGGLVHVLLTHGAIWRAVKQPKIRFYHMEK